MVRLSDASRPQEGISLTQFLDEFVPDEAAAEAGSLNGTGLTGFGVPIATRHGWPNARIDYRCRTVVVSVVVTFQ